MVTSIRIVSVSPRQSDVFLAIVLGVFLLEFITNLYYAIYAAFKA